MKKSLILILAAALALALASCGGAQGETAPFMDGDEKVLVVWFSASGNTDAVAGTIAETLKADTFEILPAEPYTDADLNWRDRQSRVSREHNDESLRDVELAAVTPEGWEDYDTVFLGYPIWWGIAAWPASSFVAANDFTGKTVVPFCTSTSSGIGESGELLADIAGAGTWLSGARFREHPSESTVQDWVQGLKLEGESASAESRESAETPEDLETIETPETQETPETPESASDLDAASQWDGTYAPLAENRVAVYIFMGEDDEYYGSQRARDAYEGLTEAYRAEGMTDSEIDELVTLNIPNADWFRERGVSSQHGGGSLIFDDMDVLNWIAGFRKAADQ